METLEAKKLISDIKKFSKKLGFNSFSISSLENDEATKRYKHWIKKNFHGEMGYLKDRINIKENPHILLSNVKRVLSFSLDYLTVPLNNLKDKINDQKEPYISIYAHGNDYHQVIKNKLKLDSKYFSQSFIIIVLVSIKSDLKYAFSTLFGNSCAKQNSIALC